MGRRAQHSNSSQQAARGSILLEPDLGRTPQNQHPPESPELVSDGIGANLRDASWFQGVIGDTEALVM